MSSNILPTNSNPDTELLIQSENGKYDLYPMMLLSLPCNYDTIAAIVPGLLKKFWPMFIGCVLPLIID